MADPALLSFSWRQGDGISRNIAPLLLLLSPLGSFQQTGLGIPLLCLLGFTGAFDHARLRAPTVSNWCPCLPQHCCLKVQMGHSEQPDHCKNYSLCLFVFWHLTMSSSTASVPLVSKVSAVSCASGTNDFFIATHRQHGKPESIAAILGLL